MRMSTASSAEPAVKRSTLTYTLFDDTKLTWAHFSLIIRSLHSYEVLEINEDQDAKTIQVTVGYFANANNARLRLGRAIDYISVTRESSNVSRDELQTLQQLRAEFGFGNNEEVEECKASKSRKKRRYADRN